MRNASEERRTVSVDEAALRLGVGRNSVYEAVRNGQIPALRIGKRWLVPIAVLNRMLREGEAA
jgi:excisionase family DNA binding protein